MPGRWHIYLHIMPCHKAYKLGLSVVTPHIKTQTKKGKDMEFLKELLGEELFTQLESRINEHNGNEANKDNQIKIGNLGKGEYVSTSKYNALQDALNGKDAEITNANKLIADLKKASEGNEDMQKKITDYEAENARLQGELKETEIRYAFEVLLMDAGVKDKDEREFLVYKHEKKLKEEGKSLELDENKHIKGGDAIVDSLKTQFPAKFNNGGAEGGDGYVPVDNTGLPKNFENKTVTREQFLQMGYNDRLKLKQENEQLYKQLAKN